MPTRQPFFTYSSDGFFSRIASYGNPQRDIFSFINGNSPITAGTFAVDATMCGALSVFNGTGCAVSMPCPTDQNPTLSYGNPGNVPAVVFRGWTKEFVNIGTGNVVLTPTGTNFLGLTPQINGASSLTLPPGTGAALRTDGLDYYGIVSGVGGGGLSADSTYLTGSTPTPAAGSGSFTSASCAMQAKLRAASPKICDIAIEVDITTNGSAGTHINVPLPYTPYADGMYWLAGMEKNVTGNMLKGYINESLSQVQITDYANNYPGSSGAKCCVSGWYQTI